MKSYLAAAALAATMLAGPATLVTVTPAFAAVCGVDAPAEWERPGGYCDQLRNTETLAEQSDAPEEKPDPCAFVDIYQYLQQLDIGDRVLMAC